MLQRIRRHLPKLLLELFILLVLLLALEAFLTRHAASGVAPHFAGTTIQGKHFDLHSLRGQPAMVHFWATWCPICALEQGSIDGLAKDVPFISVAMQSGSDKEVTAFLQQEGLDFPVVNDPDGTLSGRYGVSGVPATFVLDKDGQVRFVTRGYTSAWGLRIRYWLAGLL